MVNTKASIIVVAIITVRISQEKELKIGEHFEEERTTIQSEGRL